MITLKAALIAASAVGTLSVGGGVTWAMTGAGSDTAAPMGAHASGPAAAREAAGAPAATPTCVPAPGAKLPEPGAKLPSSGAVPGTEGLRQQDVPEVDLPAGAAEGAKEKAGEFARNGLPRADVPTAAAGEAVAGAKESAAAKAEELRRKAADLPVCPPADGDAPAAASPGAPNARVPAKPGLPEAPAARLDCRDLDPAVEVGGPAEKALMLTKGLRHEATSRAARDLGGEKVCTVAQKWTGAGGRWLSVLRVQTPSGVGEQELREGLKLPSGGTPVAVAGASAWQLPGGHGVLVRDPSGYFMHVQGSPALGQVKDVAAALRQAR
ncbi:hypothetical protein [Actinomadura sediminis]|uniref:DUF3558 domain-containing protein n=1 Tax=Actinomadura sediminis TaxID=1038904 RepID=A0ABW3EZ70_9ACTN